MKTSFYRHFLWGLSRLAAVTATVMAVTVAGAIAQGTGREQLARGQAAWDQRLSESAITAFEAATHDPSTAAEAWEALGRLYTFKGWQQEGVFGGWHDEPAYRDKALAALRASLAAQPGRASAQEALRAAEGFAAADKVDPAPQREEIRTLTAKLDAFRTMPDAPIADVVAAIDARIKAQADPTPYFTGAQILIDRGEYDRAAALAERGAAASDRFIRENLSAYQMLGKSQGSMVRGRGTAADLVGWAAFLKKDYATAETKLEEAERLLGQDFTNQFHLGELARARNASDRAREYYLNALSLSGGAAPVRQRVTEALTGVLPAGAAAGGFDAWLEAELTRRRDERRAEDLKSLVDRPLPALTLTTVDGRPYDTSGLRGKVLLLNFFASW